MKGLDYNYQEIIPSLFHLQFVKTIDTNGNTHHFYALEDISARFE